MKKAPSKWKGAYRNDYLINKETNFVLQEIDLFFFPLIDGYSEK
ncbi:hypothetical protein [Priestia megaterium]